MTGATKQRATKRIRSIEIVIISNYIFEISVLGRQKREGDTTASLVPDDDTSNIVVTFSF